LVRRTGGLADSVADCSLENLADGSACGFVFERSTQADFDAAVRRAFALFADNLRWQQVQQHAISLRFGWDVAATRYLALYQEMVNRPQREA
jgi:starch synthase